MITVPPMLARPSRVVRDRGRSRRRARRTPPNGPPRARPARHRSSRRRRRPAPRPSLPRPASSGQRKASRRRVYWGWRMVSATGAGAWHWLHVTAIAQTPSVWVKPGNTSVPPLHRGLRQIDVAHALSRPAPRTAWSQSVSMSVKLVMQIGGGLALVEAEQHVVDLVEDDGVAEAVLGELAPVDEPLGACPSRRSRSAPQRRLEVEHVAGAGVGRRDGRRPPTRPSARGTPSPSNRRPASCRSRTAACTSRVLSAAGST